MANRLIESAKTIINGIRIKPNKQNTNNAGFPSSNDIVDLLTSLDHDSIREIVGINNFRDISDNREEQYDAFDEMERDASISAALKMYADDATQYNLDGDVIWAESADSNIANFANRLLKVLRINEHAWSHIYNLIKYGDIYLETFYDDEVDSNSLISKNVKGMYGAVTQTHKIGARIDEYVEMFPNPAVIFDLKKRGKTEGFIKINEDYSRTKNQRLYSVNLSGTDQKILPADKYIHIMLAEASDRFPEIFEITFSEKGEDRTYSYTVAKGKSMLFDAFKAYRELKLMEDSILLNRVTRSAITRILQIEVGDMPKPQVKEKLRQIKMMIEQKNFMDKNSGSFASQASPGPVDNVIYVPTRNGNGAITMSSLGGDIDPKSLLDIEYYQQKEAGILGVPLSYLCGHCFRGSTRVRLADNSSHTIKEMFNDSDKYIGENILSCNEHGVIETSQIVSIQLTKLNAEFIRIILDSGEYVEVTPEHRMMKKDGSFVKAEELKSGDLLMSYGRPEYQEGPSMTHSVAKVVKLDIEEEAYDITVSADSHTFALSCGIFVHNSGDGGGLSSGTALTKLDNKYARAVKRIQNAYIQGITNLINLFAIRKGFPDYVNSFTIKMVSPSTIEDDDRDQQLDNRINMLTNLVDFLKNLNIYDDNTIKEVTEYLTSTFLNKSEVSRILEEDDTVADKVVEDDKEFEDEYSEPSDNFRHFNMPDFDNDNNEIIDTGDIVDVAERDVESNNEDQENAESDNFGNFEEFV